MHIYVGNLSLDTTEAELRREFSAFGQVKSIIVMNDKYIGSGQPRGYGYVEMASKAAGVTAVANLKGKILRNRAVCVIEALPLSFKRGMPIPDIKDIYRSSRRRERKCQMI